MKLTNLYNYEGSKSMRVIAYNDLDSAPMLSITKNKEDRLVESFPPGIYDSARENKAYLDLIKHLGLAGVSLEELVEVVHQAQINNHPVFQVSSKNMVTRQEKLTLKVNYVLKRIDTYWPNKIDKSLVLYKRLFIGQTLAKISKDIGVGISMIKFLITDFRKLLKLYKTYLCRHNVSRKLTSQHLVFIKQFLV